MKLLSVASARPNFVKLAAVHHAIVNANKKGADIEHIIVHTGQHYDPLLSDIFFKQLEIARPNENLGIRGATQDEVIERTKITMLPTLKKYKPDFLLVYGDVNGALGAALAGKEAGMRIAHIEAGLRSGDLEMPEENNRIAIDAIADILFCTEKSGVKNLESEGRTGRIELVGNTMIDTLIRMMPFIDKEVKQVLKDLNISQGTKFGVATIHRPSNVDDSLTLLKVMDFLKEVSKDCLIILPAHPRLKFALEKVNFPMKPGALFDIESQPRAYLNFLALVKLSSFILTDSGGIQEEAVLLGKRCFTLRRNTERPSTIDSGSNILIDPDNSADRQKVLDFAAAPKDPSVKIPPMWDGKAGERIIEHLRTRG